MLPRVTSARKWLFHTAWIYCYTYLPWGLKQWQCCRLSQSDTCKHPAQSERNSTFNVTTEKIIKSIESPVLLSSKRKANWSSNLRCFVFSGITWTTASGRTCLFASSRRPSRVRAFTSLLEPCRWALPALSSALQCCCSGLKEIHGIQQNLTWNLHWASPCLIFRSHCLPDPTGSCSLAPRKRRFRRSA